MNSKSQGQTNRSNGPLLFCTDMAPAWACFTGMQVSNVANDRNFDGLSNVPGTKIYALDLLGMGNSSRPRFRVRSKDPMAKIDEAEAFFIDALEEWRQIKKLDKFMLMVFSLLEGG